MAQKRYKISFETVNAGKYTVIPPEEVAAFGKRLREAMRPIDREFKRKQAISILAARNLIINR